MIIKINRDAVAGLLLAILGASFAAYAYRNYPVGVISRMGPGMVPVIMGCLLFVIALAILLRSLTQPAESIQIDVRAALLVLASIAFFALTIEAFGTIPALLGLIIISGMAAPGRNIIHIALFALGVSAVVVFIFVYLMQLNLSLFRWPS